MKKFYPFLLLAGIALWLPLGNLLLAQQNFVPLKDGEYEVEQAPRPTIEDAVISGRFEMTYLSQRNSFLGNRTESGRAVQDFELGFRSNLHDHISINALLANYSILIGDQPEGYHSANPLEQGDSSTDTGMNLIFKEAYLEYDHNPNAVLKIGQHSFAVADKMGLVYKGVSNGFSQTCRVGTWCYYFGAAKLNKGINDNLMFAQLTYPVYENGQEIFDPFTGAKRQSEGLYIELFRNFYRGEEIPLANYGGRTGGGSLYHLADSSGRLIYFDNHKTEYFGTNLSWVLPAFRFDLNYIALAGDRDYWAGALGSADRSLIARRHQTGTLWYSRNTYYPAADWKLSFDYLQSSGQKRQSASETYYASDRTDYVEVQKGYFGEAQVYFQGLQNTGNSHSVSNLTFRQYGLNYRHPVQKWGLDFAFYQFYRTAGVFNQSGEVVDRIGQELDIRYGIEFDKNLVFKFGYGAFRPQGAYSNNDNLAPTKMDLFSAFGAQLAYHF
ncbi:MAG: hypothetical protein A2600_13980 [Candidatus Lambdaproteobacteria bacterium RIFOXYD1_FULL_56_27]|uniref:Alginate export domain-containing protein n=1 Tax=Candidatus Lambdaproteobacteria bacterium RIFOXYD2_FULL_56_26 TaxID=1817773 RepID=A0A1F6GNX0_9PROT|nr:MAG: hypothetical protein A2557_06205 [Candidatus Lambdaproteobacteria bacterium RIFOXYD2_FULL_56_26]OGG99898.1 MAG: hypothetical protein A2426_09940 [Candidatus Lambdaproteobacteria bacterium RIFOXYC1_FULL_56_13]OGH06297.1 MAG: hypothetical protein A2600_13980 [Candidatus Lambdaproteobacteria bacterium RIFOXYD1_FULL_56_27]